MGSSKLTATMEARRPLNVTCLHLQCLMTSIKSTFLADHLVILKPATMYS